MKILQVHNYYKNPGGEDSVVKNEYELLIKNGHEVIQYTRHNSDIKSWRSKLLLLRTTHYSKRSFNEFKEVLKTLKPDIVHVHNVFPLFTPSIFDACLECKIPAVMTVHNFRIFHPNGLFLHKGKQDMRGLNSSAYLSVFSRVYRDSFTQTAIAAHMIEFHKKKDTWNKKITTLIVLSTLSEHLLIQGGIWKEKLIVKPNFCEDSYKQIKIKEELLKKEYFVFVGRISEEKGIIQLLNHYKSKKITNQLIIIGDGPLKERLQKETIKNDIIIWKGSLSHLKAITYIKNSKALIFPSICLENFPMTIVESLSLGVPVLASNIGAAKYIIENNKEGILFNPFKEKELTNGIQTLLNLEKRNYMSKKARELYLKKFTPEINYKLLIKIYNESISKTTGN